MKLIKIITILSSILLFFGSINIKFKEVELLNNNSNKNIPYKGVNFISWKSGEFQTNRSYGLLEKVESIGVDTIAINPIGIMETRNSNYIYYELLPEEDIEKMLIAVKRKDLKIMLKPMINVEDGTWRALIEPANLELWWKSYRSWIINYAILAEKYDVEILCIGTELRSMSGEKYRKEWESMISKIRSVYSGQLTYAANSGELYEKDELNTVSFWDLIDLPGINLWHKLSRKENPSLEELEKAWLHNSDGINIVELITDWQKKHGKNFLIIEVGTSSIKGSTQDTGHYEWDNKVLDEREQANYYESFFSVWSNVNSLRGVFWWAISIDRNDDFTFERKQAEKVITKWWKR